MRRAHESVYDSFLTPFFPPDMLAFTPDLATGNAEIDDHHVQFIDALNAVSTAADGDMVALLTRLSAHCDEHFGFENQQMEESGFPPIGCHLGEHEMVQETVREVLRRAEAGEPQFARNLGPALAQWFGQHARTMDVMLAQHLAGAPAAGVCETANAV